MIEQEMHIDKGETARVRGFSNELFFSGEFYLKCNSSSSQKPG